MNINFLKSNTDSAIAAVVGFVIVLLFSQHNGIGISPDSIAYSSAARNLIAGNGFTDYSDKALVIFPLFYPFFLALVMFITQADIVVIAPYLNGFLFSTVIFLSGVLIENFKYKTKLYKRLLLLLITISPSLIEIYTMLWSETLFIFLSLIFIYTFRTYFHTHSLLSLGVAGLITAFAFDTRYAGITLLATGGLLIFFDKNLSWQNKFLHIIYYGSTSISLVFLNLIRNVWEVGLATGQRQQGITPFSKNVEYSGKVFTDWFSINIENQLYLKIIFVIVLILFIVFFVRNVRHWKAYYTFENIIVSFFLVYVMFIVVSSTISRYEPINNRLLAPAFIPLLLVSTCQIPKWRKLLPKRLLRWVVFAFSIGIGILFAYSFVQINKENLEYMLETGIPGYSEDTWQKSQLVTYLEKHPEIFDADSVVYSNHSQAVYFLTGNRSGTLPERAYKKDVEEFMSETSGILIWFNLDDNPDLLNLKEIGKTMKLKRLKTFRDGAIYKFEKP